MKGCTGGFNGHGVIGFVYLVRPLKDWAWKMGWFANGSLLPPGNHWRVSSERYQSDSAGCQYQPSQVGLMEFKHVLICQSPSSEINPPNCTGSHTTQLHAHTWRAHAHTHAHTHTHTQTKRSTLRHACRHVHTQAHTNQQVHTRTLNLHKKNDLHSNTLTHKQTSPKSYGRTHPQAGLNLHMHAHI